MRTLSELSQAQLAADQASAWSRVTINGQVMLPQQVMSYSFSYPRGDHGATAEIVLANESGVFTDYFAYGQIVQIEEGIVDPNGTVEDFGGFYGEIAVISPQEMGSSKLVIKCVDYVGKLSGLDIDTQIESPKTGIESEGLTPTYLPAPNGNMAQVFAFAHSALCTNPPVQIFIYDKRTQYKFLQESGYEIDSANGTLLMGRPVNLDNFNVIASYSYYPAATALYVEDVLEQIITQLDGYGNTPFSVAENLLERLSQVDKVGVDTMLPNYEPTTINGTEYGRYRVWYTSYNNIQTDLAAGDFTVPGGAVVSSVSELYGRIILDQSLTEDALVTCNVDYQFCCLQATGVQVNYLSVRGMKVKNRWDAVKAAKAVLAPNYVIGTKQTSPGKLWGRYVMQSEVSHADLEMVMSEDIDKDSDVYTRVVLYGQNINPHDLAMDTDVGFVIPSEFLALSTVRWNAVDWSTQGSPSSTPALVYGRCEIESGDAIQSVNTLQRGTFRTRLRAGANYAWRVGFISAASLGSTAPEGVFFESEGLYASMPARATPQRGYIYCVCRDGAGGANITKQVGQWEVTRQTDRLGAPISQEIVTVEAIALAAVQDVDLIIEWTSTEATFYVNGRNAGTIATNLPTPPAHIVFEAADGQLSVESCAANGDNGTEVRDEFLTQDYIGRAYRHPMAYVESGDDFRRYNTGIIAGRILAYPPPLIYVNGIPLVQGVHEVTDAPVFMVEGTYTYGSGGGLFSSTRVDSDYTYTVHFSHRSLSPMYDIVIYDYLGNVWATIPASTPAEINRASGYTQLDIAGQQTLYFILPGWYLNRVDYARGLYYVPHPLTRPIDIRVFRSPSEETRRQRAYFEHQQEFSLRSADYYVQYSDDIMDIDYECGLLSIRESAFANEIEDDDDRRPRDIVEGTFYYLEAYGTMHNAFALLDGDMSTAAQMAFKAPPVPGHHLFTLDLQADERIDAIDISGGFYIPPGEDGTSRKLAVSMNLSLYTSPDGVGAFTLPCKEAYNFGLSSGEVMTFDHEQLGDGFSARYLQLRVESVENITFGSIAGIWPVVIQQFRVYQDVIVKAEASLVTDSADVDDTHLEDTDGLLASLGDRVYKMNEPSQFLGSKATLERVAKGMLEEFYKNHTRMRAEIAFGPHYEQGATVAVTDPSNKITNERYFVEAYRCQNGRRSLELARYP